LEVFIGFVVLLISAFALLAWLTRKSGSKGSKSRQAMGAGLFAINEIFHPAAHESSIAIEDQREARAPLPTPEDKENPGL
jgi:hypothetical protein